MNCPMFPTKWFLATILALGMIVGQSDAADDSLRTVSAASVGSRTDCTDSVGMSLVSGTPSQDFTCDSIVLFLNHGGVGDTVTAILCDDAANSPNNVLGKSLDTLPVTNTSGTDGRYKFRLTYSMVSGTVYWFGVANVSMTDASGVVNVRHSGSTPSTVRWAISTTALSAIPSAVTTETMFNGLDYAKFALYGHTGSGEQIKLIGGATLGGGTF